MNRFCQHCQRPIPRRDLRPSHYAKRRFCCRHCKMAYQIRDPITRFWDKVQKTPQCWLWTASCFSGGYGQFAVTHRRPTPAVKIGAHQYSWMLTHGCPIPEGMDILHSCDVRRCVNPAHLFLGTAKDNMSDAAIKQHLCKKLTANHVRQIRAAPPTMSHSALSRQYGVTPSNIRLIRIRQSWRHVV